MVLTETMTEADSALKFREGTKSRAIGGMVDRGSKSQILQGGYTSVKRRMEKACILSFTVILAINVVHGLQYSSQHSYALLLGGFVLGALYADMWTGIFHWTFDTWGNCETPLLAPFIRAFREHHLDPQAITRHDWIETSGDNTILCIPLSVLTTGAILPWDLSSTMVYFLHWSCIWFCLLCSLTNQFHSWAHLRNPPFPVKMLQTFHLILPADHHAEHHHNPFDCNYTITNGWCNWILDATGFWKWAEHKWTAWSGMKPREDDQLWRLASAATIAEKAKNLDNPASTQNVTAVVVLLLGAFVLSREIGLF